MKKAVLWILILSMMITVYGCKSSKDEEQAFLEQQDSVQSDGQNPEQSTEQGNTSKDDSDKSESNQDATPNNGSTENAPQTEPPKTENSPSSTENTPFEEKAPDYKQIKCKSIKNWQSVRLSFEGNIIVQIDLPQSWELIKNGEKYIINADKNQIGSISKAAFDTPKGKFDYKSDYSKEKDMVSFRQVSWYKNESRDKIYREFQFVSSDSRANVNIQVDYSQLDDSASDKLYNSAFTVPAFVNTEFVPLSECNGSKNILILGNSFIGTSQVGTFLNDMVKKEGISVKAISRGHAKISDYVSDSQICNSIQSGQYCYVFISGFYGEAQNVEHFGTLLDICKKSNTKLVLFPFHNDTDSYINETKTKYTESIFLDWKGEINSLISSGKVTREDMCQNDTYGHSTHLAGYVGAHMIYRNMFGKVPPTINNSPLSMSAVRAKLTDYVDTYKKVDVSKPSDFKGKTYTI